MCGLVFALSESQANDMADRISHRGPDARSIRILRSKRSPEAQGAFVHLRLAIVDTTSPAGNQPFSDTEDSRVTMFNGEVFNYRQGLFSRELSEVVVLHDLMAENANLSSVLNGYYAAAQYCSGDNVVTLVRDPMGVIPLYYHKKDLSVASERKAWPSYEWTNLRPVPPGGRVRINLDKKTIKVQTKDLADVFPLSVEDISATVQNSRAVNLFYRAVERTAKHSECGFDLALSGGLDSCMILYALAALGLKPSRIHTTYMGEIGAEAKRAIKAVEGLGWSSIHNLIDVSNYKPPVREWLETPANPIRDFAFIRHCAVARDAESKVILCGEGADEIGLGYPTSSQHWTPHQRWLKKISLLKSQRAMTLDRVNLAGMAYGKEYRVPFLDMDFVRYTIGNNQQNKDWFRVLALTWFKVPEDVAYAPKFGTEEIKGRGLDAASLRSGFASAI